MSLLSRAKRALSQNEPKKAPVKKTAAAKQSGTSKEAPPDTPNASQEKSQPKVQLDTWLTEKSMRTQEQDTVVFRVGVSTTKHQIAEAIQATYGVKPKAIRTARFQAKMRRRGRTVGYTSPWKKAYVKVDDVSKFTAEE